jgi:hypothetical protein
LNILIVSALVAIVVATVSAVIADRIKRRADRRERADAHLELVAVDFTRDDDAFETLTLDITVRNADTTTCPIQAALFYDIEVWQFPRPLSPSFRRISHTYDADLGGGSDKVVLHQGVPPGDVDRFAFRLGTSRPLPPGLGSFLYLFRLELILNNPTANLDLGRFLVDVRQPLRVLGYHGMPETREWRQQLAERARALARIVESDTHVESRAQEVLNKLSATPIAQADDQV